MKHFKRHMLLMKLALVLGFFAPLAASAQTDVDAIMMDKNNFVLAEFTATAAGKLLGRYFEKE